MANASSSQPGASSANEFLRDEPPPADFQLRREMIALEQKFAELYRRSGDREERVEAMLKQILKSQSDQQVMNQPQIARPTSLFEGGGDESDPSGGGAAAPSKTPQRTAMRNRESFGGDHRLMESPASNYAAEPSRENFQREPTVRLKLPELKVQKTYTHDEILIFLDSCLGHITAWESMPVNVQFGRHFPDADNFPITLIPPAAAEYICSMIGWIHSAAHCRLMTEDAISKGQFWSTMRGDTLRKLIVKSRVDDHSLTENIQRLSKVRFNSPNPYTQATWVEFVHDLNKEIRFSSEGDFQYTDVDLKDHIIRSFPDATYQRELWLIYGNKGVIKAQFQLGELLERIQFRIKRFIKDNIATDQNRSAQVHLKEFKAQQSVEALAAQQVMEAAPIAPPAPLGQPLGQWADDLDIEDFVNAAMSGDKFCSRPGTGLDHLLNCRFLGGPKETCLFKHPEQDMRLKGKGVTSKPSATVPAGAVISSSPKNFKTFNSAEDAGEFEA